MEEHEAIAECRGVNPVVGSWTLGVLLRRRGRRTSRLWSVDARRRTCVLSGLVVVMSSLFDCVSSRYTRLKNECRLPEQEWRNVAINGRMKNNNLSLSICTFEGKNFKVFWIICMLEIGETFFPCKAVLIIFSSVTVFDLYLYPCHRAFSECSNEIDSIQTDQELDDTNI